MTQLSRQQMREYSRARRAERKAQGLCVPCGKNQAEKYYISCTQCKERDRERKQAMQQDQAEIDKIVRDNYQRMSAQEIETKFGISKKRVFRSADKQGIVKTEEAIALQRKKAAYRRFQESEPVVPTGPFRECAKPFTPVIFVGR